MFQTYTCKSSPIFIDVTPVFDNSITGRMWSWVWTAPPFTWCGPSSPVCSTWASLWDTWLRSTCWPSAWSATLVWWSSWWHGSFWRTRSWTGWLDSLSRLIWVRMDGFKMENLDFILNNVSIFLKFNLGTCWRFYSVKQDFLLGELFQKGRKLGQT